jgi:hypothetical protein
MQNPLLNLQRTKSGPCTPRAAAMATTLALHKHLAETQKVRYAPARSAPAWGRLPCVKEITVYVDQL